MALTYEDVKKEFMAAVDGDAKCQKLMRQIYDGKGTYKTANDLAVRVGQKLGGVLKAHEPINGIDEWDYILREEVLNAETGAVEVAKISIQYGLWLQAIVDFFIIALSVFAAVRIIRKAERKLNAKEIAKKEAEEAKKKAEDDAKAAEAKVAADAAAAEEKAIRDEFYANVREQSALLREIRDNLKK